MYRSNRLFEFGDLNVHHLYHYYLRKYLIFFIKFVGYDKLWKPQMESFLRQSNANTVMEYGAGSGEALMRVISQTDPALTKGMKFTLSDINPLPEFVEAVNSQQSCFTYLEEPVDAANAEKYSNEPKIFINSFHHLNPTQAKEVIKNNVEAGNSLLILEYVKHNPLAYLLMLGGFFTVLFSMPFIARKKDLPVMLLFTYIIPLFPLMLVFDGIVSCGRSYDQKFFEACANELGVKVVTDTKANLLYPAGVQATRFIVEKN